ncbi:MAG TPA: MaoC family dehydratase [Xanthobacteraceae bacterium]|jgi:acyl dehydratase|nr:MaoC family dehydratase [Xanthobacteraceae bacterium]
MNYLEDIKIGERTVIGQHTFTAEEIKTFAAKFDPQPFHLDETAAARSHFGALCASGWHSAVMWMQLAVAYRKEEAAAKRARGEPVAWAGPSPGFRDLKWLKPVYTGDTITYATEVMETRVSQSRPGVGLMTVLNTGTNQAGELVLSFVSSVFVERRPG